MNASHKISLRHVLLAATILSSPLIAAATSNPAAAQISVSISVPIAPPELPVYEQPPIPDVGYVWTPGYWAWDQAGGYYWVPGTWVQPPRANVLWTPPYWGWSNGVYLFHTGYWAAQVGYYGGVNYGYGYSGRGYEGGRWQGGHFAYNRSVNNLGSVHVTNVYEQNVTVANDSRVSFQGGSGGLKTEPTAGERRAEQEHHVAMTAAQTSLIVAAAKRPDLAAKQNGGHPGIVAMSRPGQFDGPGVIHGQPASANAEQNRPGQTPGQAQAEHGAGNPADRGVAPNQREATRPGQPTPGQPVPGQPTLGQAGAAHPNEHTATAPSGRDSNSPSVRVAPEALRPNDHVAAPAGVAHEAPKPGEHAAGLPALHEEPRPGDHAAAPPAAHEEPRPADHAAAPPAMREEPRPADHAAAPPAERAAPPAEHAAAPPVQHAAPPPAEHAAAPPPPAAHAMAQAAPHPGPGPEAAHPAAAEKGKEPH